MLLAFSKVLVRVRQTPTGVEVPTRVQDLEMWDQAAGKYVVETECCRAVVRGHESKATALHRRLGLMQRGARWRCAFSEAVTVCTRAVTFHQSMPLARLSAELFKK